MVRGQCMPGVSACLQLGSGIMVFPWEGLWWTVGYIGSPLGTLPSGMRVLV